MISAAQLDELTRFSNAAVADIPRELRALQASLVGAAPEVARDALLEVAPAIADRHGRVMAAGSAEWFERVRRAEVGGQFYARPAGRPDPDVVRSNVRYAAGALFLDHRVSPFESLSGSLTRHVMDVGRETIRDNTTRDSRAVGWQRIAQPDGCDFCIMLHSRGAVYKRATADFASHDHCRCRCAPSWDRDAPEVSVRAYEASQKTSSMSPAQKARHNRTTRTWLESQKWQLDDFRAAMS